MEDTYQSINSRPSNSSQDRQAASIEEDKEEANDNFDYLYFAKFLHKRAITIIPFSEVSITSSNATGESATFRHGTSMQVYFGDWQSRTVALKVPKYESRQYDRLMYDIYFEIQVMSHKSLLEHPNIVTLMGMTFAEDTVSSNPQIRPILVVEAAHSLYSNLTEYIDVIDHVPLSLAYELIGDIADGLTALHTLGVVHGDIKPENILVFEGERLIAKIGDFGSCGVDVSMDPPRGGTELWSPPEYSRFNREIGEISHDIYAFGLVCAEWAIRTVPYRTVHSLLDSVRLALDIFEREPNKHAPCTVRFGLFVSV
jgi:serine/threonine protein kinase